MADIPLDALVSGGEFKATTCSGTLSIPSGTSGTLATLTSTGGRKIRLTLLLFAGGTETGISVIADGVAVVNSLSLSTATALTAGNFSVGSAASGGTPYIGNIRHIEANSTITITKASGSTSGIIYYATEQGF
jgi:N-acetylmuramic acid 6-phosphate (MurNAc-6-P) etherase